MLALYTEWVYELLKEVLKEDQERRRETLEREMIRERLTSAPSKKNIV